MNQNYYHSLPRTFVNSPEDRKENYSVEKRITFINRTHREVVVCERSNLKLVLPPLPSFGKEQEVIIRVEYYINNEKVKINTELLLDRLRLVGDHLKIFRNAFSCSSNHRQFGGIDFIVEYPIHHNVLDEHGGFVYYKEIDTVIGLTDRGECPDHPFSHEAEMDCKYGYASSESIEYGLNIDIFINDPKNKYGERYVNVLGKVHCIRTVNIDNKREGIYLTKLINGKPDDLYFPFADIEKEINLYRIEDDAIANGHVDIVLKKNLAELENRNLVLKKELEESKLSFQRKEIEYDIKKMELEREKDEWKSKKDKEDLERKAEFERLKDQFERRTYARKDYTEALKFIPAVVVGLGSVFLAIKTIMKDDK